MIRREPNHRADGGLTRLPDPAADRAWEALVEELDYEGTDDPVELAAAQERLRAAEEDAVPASRVAAMVAAVAGGDNIVRRHWLRSAVKVAASLPGALLLCAAVTVTLLWFGGMFSTKTMNYQLAIAILQRDDQLPGDYRSALMQSYKRIRSAIEAIQAVGKETPSVPPLAVAALAGMDQLRETWHAQGVAARPVVDEDLMDVSAALLDTTLSEQQRFQLVGRTVELARAGLLAIQQLVPPDADVAANKVLCTKKLDDLLLK